VRKVEMTPGDGGHDQRDAASQLNVGLGLVLHCR
jgi:hypothetical protein